MKKLTFSLILILAFIANTFILQAATVRTSPSSGSANWGSVSWTTTGTGTPITYVIQSGFTATINTSTTLGTGDSIIIYGTISFNNSRDLNIPGSTAFVQVANGGLVTGGNSSSDFRVGSSRNRGPFNIIGPAYSTNSTTFTRGDALPVTWGYIYSETTLNGQNIIRWSTASELNNSHFEIERAGSNGEFIKIDQVAGQGTSFEINEYVFTDLSPLNGANYYRIRQVDYDGKFDYSSIIDIFNTHKSAVKLYPNVIQQFTENIHLENVIEGSKISIFDPQGRLVTEFINHAKDGNAVNTFNLQNSLGNKDLYLIHSERIRPNFV